MKHIHMMKKRLAHELSETCEKWLGEDLDLDALKCLKHLAGAFNKLHESCRIMHDMEEHSGKHMTDHYK